MRELLDRIGLANAIVGVVTAAVAVLILMWSPWRENFDVNETLELLATLAAITLALGAFAVTAHIVGLILDAIERRTE